MDLKELRQRAKDTQPDKTRFTAEEVNAVFAELDRTHKLHVEEQRRSADRLRIAVEALKIARNALDEIAKVGVGRGTDK
jgi:hypothetical protein